MKERTQSTTKIKLSRAIDDMLNSATPCGRRAMSAPIAARRPEVPTIAEQGFPGFERFEGVNFWAPTGTPELAIARISEAVAVGLRDADVRARLDQLGITPVGGTPQELMAGWTAYVAWATEVIRSENLRME